MPPEHQDDPLPKDPKERKHIMDLAQAALDKFGVHDLTEAERESIVRANWLEWEPKFKHLLAKTGKLEF